MGWHVYEVISPIDFGWEYLKTVSDTELQIAQAADNVKLKAFKADWDLAQALAKQKGWEGDFQIDPRVFWLPFACEFEYGFVFKQENNGTTFVVSPVELAYLNDQD